MSKHEVPVSDDFWESCVTEHKQKPPPNSKTTDQFAEETGLPRTTAGRKLRAMVDEGVLQKVKIGRYFYYYPPNNANAS